MKNVLETKYFSFKVSNDRRATRTYSLKKNNNASMKRGDNPKKRSEASMNLSNDDLLQKQEEILDRFEETRQAEEALAQNMKLLKKQKMRFHNLQKILSRNVILLPLCGIFSILSAVSLLAGTLTDYYQYSSFNIEVLRGNIVMQNNATMQRMGSMENQNGTLDPGIEIFELDATEPGDNYISQDLNNKKSSEAYFFNIGQLGLPSRMGDEKNGKIWEKGVELRETSQLDKEFVFSLEEKFDAFILTRHDYFSADNLTDKSLSIYPSYWGIWRVCNYLSEDALGYLDISKCNFYRSLFEFNSVRFVTKTIDLEYIDMLNSNPGRDLIRMHNAAACCVIVAYFLLIFSWITALIALLSKSVPVTLTTSVLNALISVFLILLLAIAHRKLLQMQRQRDCFDVKRIFGTVVCTSRTVRFGYSLGLTWLALIFTTLTSSCWYHIAKIQKLLFTHGYYYNYLVCAI